MVAAVASPEELADQFFASGMSVDSWMAHLAQQAPVTKPSDFELVVKVADTLGRKFELQDIINGGAQGTWLYETAGEWLTQVPEEETAWSDWLAELARKYKRGGGLTDGQAKGVLNCLVASERRKARMVAPARNAELLGKLERQKPYRNPDAEDNRLEEIAERRAEEEAARAYRESLREDEDEVNARAYTHHMAAQVSKGFYTIVSPEGNRTLKISKWGEDRYREGQVVRWISFLSGSNNTSDYTTFARQDEDGELHMLTKFKGNAMLKEMAELILFGTVSERDEMRGAYALESNNCAICNRMLTVEDSIRRGIGPICAESAF
jgi:hypothetical protein